MSRVALDAGDMQVEQGICLPGREMVKLGITGQLNHVTMGEAQECAWAYSAWSGDQRQAGPNL